MVNTHQTLEDSCTASTCSEYYNPPPVPGWLSSCLNVTWTILFIIWGLAGLNAIGMLILSAVMMAIYDVAIPAFGLAYSCLVLASLHTLFKSPYSPFDVAVHICVHLGSIGIMVAAIVYILLENQAHQQNLSLDFIHGYFYYYTVSGILQLLGIAVPIILYREARLQVTPSLGASRAAVSYPAQGMFNPNYYGTHTTTVTTVSTVYAP